MIKKDEFADLEQMRLKHLKDEIVDALIEFDKDKKMQWISMRLEKVLVETILEALEKQIPKKIKESISGCQEVTGVCPTCSVIHFIKQDYCYHCGQAIDWSVEE